MQPESAPAAIETLHRVRQQLILAQVRIMELEDVRDGLSGKLDDTEKLLIAAQLLADQKAEEASHLANVRADLQAQYEHMRHMQHVTNEALNLTRDQLAAAEKDRSRLQQKIISLVDQATQLNNTSARLSDELKDCAHLAATRLEQVNQLEAGIRAIESSRSWRWTSWLRSITRALSSKHS